MNKKRIILQGDISSPANPPSGCRFHTRCPYATERCKTEAPQQREVEPGHYVVCHLYEKFILSFYKKEFPELHAAASQVAWDLDDEQDEFLPIMQSDITLSKGEKVLIIDAKYYAHTMQTQYDVHTLHSGNLYQIFTYVKNRDSSYGDAPHEVSGMLLYARTDEEFPLPSRTYRMSGNKIAVRTLDLNCDFAVIRQQLQMIAEEYFA